MFGSQVLSSTPSSLYFSFFCCVEIPLATIDLGLRADGSLSSWEPTQVSSSDPKFSTTQASAIHTGSSWAGRIGSRRHNHSLISGSGFFSEFGQQQAAMRRSTVVLAASAGLASATWNFGRDLGIGIPLPARETGSGNAHVAETGWTPRPTEPPGQKAALDLLRRGRGRPRERQLTNTWVNDQTCGWFSESACKSIRQDKLSSWRRC